MPTDDFSQVTATLDPPANGKAYVKGEKLTARISGSDVVSDTEDLEITMTIRNKTTGATTTVPVVAPAQLVAVANESVVIDSLADPDRAWTVSADGLTATAIA